MFASSKQDMKYWISDNSGITIDPHPQSPVRPENRGHYTMYKAITHGLTSVNLRVAGQEFQAALQRRIDALPVHDEWVQNGRSLQLSAAPNLRIYLHSDVRFQIPGIFPKLSCKLLDLPPNDAKISCGLAPLGDAKSVGSTGPLPLSPKTVA